MKKAIPHQQSSFVRQNFFLMIFLSLQLMLLSFFIFFVSHSSFEKNKIQAVQTSLRSSFNVPSSSLSFEANAIELYYQTQLKKIFPNSKIEHHLNNDTIKITFDIQTLFKQNSDNFSLYASVFFKQIKQLLQSSLILDNYLVYLILFEDSTVSANYPVYSHLTSKRVAKIASHLEELEDLSSAVRLGVYKGDKNQFVLFLAKGKSE